MNEAEIQAMLALRESLLEMTGDVEWMSGSPDFAPGDYGSNVPAGQVHEGRLKVQPRLARALALLEEEERSYA